MSDYYQHYLPGTGETPSPNPQDPQTVPQHPMMQMGNSAPTPMAGQYQSLGYFTGFPDPIMFQPPKAQSGRNRRKSAPGLDHVKHRRTRSGCYTCRSRRVKCDEGRPTCERCRKGKRECVYPEPSASKSQGGSVSSKDANAAGQGESPGSSQEEYEDDIEKDDRLDPILDEEGSKDSSSQATRSLASPRRKSTASTLNLQRAGTRHSSETPSSSPSLSTGTSASFAVSFHASDPSIQPMRSDWSHLPPDLRFYLDYFCENITNYSYCVIGDPDDFFRSFLPSIAIRSGNEALLYAVVGFSAYHYTTQDPNGGIHEFLQYYNKSVTLLLNSFKRRDKQYTATLLTILQLATIEEYLGDWVSLMGHQKAALQILTHLFTTQSVMQSSVTRMILSWYVRFDVFVGMMGGFETMLPREWFSASVDFAKLQVADGADDIGWKTEVSMATLRLITVDMSRLYAKAARKEITGPEFVAEHDHLSTILYEWRNDLDPALIDSNFRVSDFSYRQPLDDADIVDPYGEGFLYGYPLFSTTLMLAEWHSIILMHKSQEALALQQEPTPELRNMALSICQIFESVQRWPLRPNGTIVILQACLGIAGLFLPRDTKHHMWMRRKFAFIESFGYVFPLTMRQRMAEMFRDPTCVHWWLPNDEGLSPVIRSIRTFADERNATPVSQQTENLREMSAIFAKIRLDYDETPSPLEPPGSSSSRGKGKDVAS